MKNLAVVVMAAGMGTRMKSKTPKVLHPLLEKPLLWHVLQAVFALQPAKTVVVVGHQSEQVQARFTNQADFVVQSPQLGTGHAVQQARKVLGDHLDTVLVVPGDLPLLSGDTFRRMRDTFDPTLGPMLMLTVTRDNPQGFGRIVRDEAGFVSAIVEEADCTPEQKAIRELNVGAYIFNAQWLWQNLPRIPVSAKGEYYLTNLVGIAVSQGYRVQAVQVDNPAETLGVNTRAHLAQAESVLRQQVNQKWMEAGVTLVDPNTTYIGLDVTIGQDTVIYPNTYLLGQTTIGEDCEIGPNSYIIDSTVGNGCQVRFSVVEQAVMENNVDIGPFAHLRKGAHLAEGVHMGNFGEVKNAYLGPGTKMGHFSYLGDITTGKNVNIGAGTITCNYDGVKKNPTVIGDNAFIGSDTMLVAPVKIGNNARTGAGSVVTRDIPDDALAYGVPARVKSEKK
ncbi:MAG: UDP-N-acetylglucosamine diphosphorylase/glucosamine-1-phosphate N-acetyltransferase [Chloroflexi bacterium]|nr:MAG: UDP-N-acetylglucosamine diphosphorylase/glucosamine-1-phosphate N-acetyltransferase [Chloroflexota bacterium]